MGLQSRILSLGYPEFLMKHALRRFGGNQGVVLMYHEVLPGARGIPAWTVVRLEDFQWQMAQLKSHFDVISLDEAIQRVHSGRTYARPFAVVTFDDGYAGNYHHVLPLMAEMELPFTVYVATRAVVKEQPYWHDRIIGLLALQRPLRIEIGTGQDARRFHIPFPSSEVKRWNAMQALLSHLKSLEPGARQHWVERILADAAKEPAPEMSMNGPESAIGLGPVPRIMTRGELEALAASPWVTLGNHSHGHELLDQLEPHRIAQSLARCTAVLDGVVGGRYPIRHFAYPNGNYNDTVTQAVREQGLISAVTTQGGPWNWCADPLRIPRYGIGRFDGRNLFRAKISALLRH